MKSAILLAALCLPTLSAMAAEPAPVTPIASLDVPRYMGTWYEIAKYPNRFQKQCAGFTVANYSVQPDRSVKVVNRCKTASGATEEAIGTALQQGGPSSPMLKVRFAPAWLSILPFVWGDYWVIDLDDKYQLAAVSDRKREYLWVLSRAPTVERKAYADLLVRLGAQGFDVNKLVSTKQVD
ncbi:MAG: lipocalin family protein [Massilia sp.]